MGYNLCVLMTSSLEIHWFQKFINGRMWCFCTCFGRDQTTSRFAPNKLKSNTCTTEYRFRSPSLVWHCFWVNNHFQSFGKDTHSPNGPIVKAKFALQSTRLRMEKVTWKSNFRLYFLYLSYNPVTKSPESVACWLLFHLNSIFWR